MLVKSWHAKNARVLRDNRDALRISFAEEPLFSRCHHGFSWFCVVKHISLVFNQKKVTAFLLGVASALGLSLKFIFCLHFVICVINVFANSLRSVHEDDHLRRVTN